MYDKAVRNLAKTLGSDEEPGLAMLLSFEGVLETEVSRDVEKYRPLIEPVLFAAADQFEAERVREGKHTGADILCHLGVLEESAKAISVYVPEIETTIKENLRGRFAELLGDKIDESRILTETAVLLMKYTIAEELARLSSHLAEFRAETERALAAAASNGNDPIATSCPGRKLDFLCQELNREINTIGSKTPMLEVSRLVVRMKDALENIREQLRNVE
jgi:uncharacterized protein (TIGR00255 family)